MLGSHASMLAAFLSLPPSLTQQGSHGFACRQLEASIQAGQGSLPWLAEQFRALCDAVLSTTFHTNRKLAQEASDLLDYGNALLQVGHLVCSALWAVSYHR